MNVSQMSLETLSPLITEFKYLLITDLSNALSVAPAQLQLNLNSALTLQQSNYLPMLIKKLLK